ncbi:MAG: hypothetical protein MUF75_07090 [Bacteroidia bacterium]|jgi:hypothetical protein|nr:hypothetical protein [Bacteroidia bacterium]
MSLLLKLSIVLPLLFVACDNQAGDDAYIEEDVAAINKSCPKLLDEETQLEKVVFVKPSLIIYNYLLVNLSLANVDTAQFRMALWPGILSGIRVDEGLSDLRERKMNFEYRYYDKNKKLIYTFKIGPGDYKN